MVDFELLKAPFPKDTISWRAQSFTQDGTKALALAYCDARDVMNRLDDVCGPAGWQCRYSHAMGKTVCDIGIKCSDEWVWKADGAGDSDIEAEKGALSDAFKRAAVRWGIGRYLYSLDAVWVPCETKEWNGKKQFVKWIVDPWTKVKLEQRSGFETAKKQNAKWETIADDLRSVGCESSDIKELLKIWENYTPELTVLKRSDMEIYKQLEEIKDNAKLDISARAGMGAGFGSVR
jgi:hypothetical protein